MHVQLGRKMTKLWKETKDIWDDLKQIEAVTEKGVESSLSSLVK